jgi:hypothetical protein
MRKLTMTLTAVVLVLGTMAMTASAQTQAPIAASFPAQLQNATPFVEQAACTSTSFIAQFKNTTPFINRRHVMERQVPVVVGRVGSVRALPGVAGAFPATERQDRTTAMNAREAAGRWPSLRAN